MFGRMGLERAGRNQLLGRGMIGRMGGESRSIRCPVGAPNYRRRDRDGDEQLQLLHRGCPRRTLAVQDEM